MFRFIARTLWTIFVTLAVIAGLIFGVGYVIDQNSEEIGQGIEKLANDLDEEIHKNNLRVISGDLTPDERKKMEEYERAFRNGTL